MSFNLVTVHNYKSNPPKIRSDAFRGPLASAFKLHLDDLVSFRGMDQECLRTDGLSEKYRYEHAKDKIK